MRKLSFILITIFLVNTGKVISTDYNQDFDNSYLSEYSYLSQVERETIWYLNYVRMHPKQFCAEYVIPYDPDYKGYGFYERKASLITHLKSMSPILDEIRHDEDMYQYALCFAVKGGELGVTGHNRRSSECSYPPGAWGENMDWGDFSGLEHILRLLVDDGEGNESLGHRENCLNQEYTIIGVAERNHIKWEKVTVMDFSYPQDPKSYIKKIYL